MGAERSIHLTSLPAARYQLAGQGWKMLRSSRVSLRLILTQSTGASTRNVLEKVVNSSLKTNIVYTPSTDSDGVRMHNFHQQSAVIPSSDARLLGRSFHVLQVCSQTRRDAYVDELRWMHWVSNG